jgi:hypothetical protein
MATSIETPDHRSETAARRRVIPSPFLHVLSSNSILEVFLCLVATTCRFSVLAVINSNALPVLRVGTCVSYVDPPKGQDASTFKTRAQEVCPASPSIPTGISLTTSAADFARGCSRHPSAGRATVVVSEDCILFLYKWIQQSHAPPWSFLLFHPGSCFFLSCLILLSLAASI